MKKAFMRVFNAGWTNFKRNGYLSFGTTGVMTMVMLLFAGLLVVNFVSGQIVTGLQDKVDVSVYFKTEASEDQIKVVKSDLESKPEVKSVTYISRDQALEDFKQTHAGQAVIQQSLEELNFNPLEASLNVKAKDPNQYAAIVQSLEANKFRTLMDKINFYENEAVIKKVQGITDGIRSWGFLATLVLAVVAVLVTFNTIRLTIYNQRQEIHIMKLVGGSNWYVKAPFLIEGGLYGVIAATLASAIFYPLIWFVSGKVSILLPGVSLINYFAANIIQFVFLMLFVGLAIGIVSSSVAIRKFLQV